MSREQRDKGSYVQAMFSRIADRYDLMNSLMTLGKHHAWRRRAVALADPPPGGLALDLGCGTADMAIELAHYPLKHITGIDFSLPMLREGRAKIENLGLQHRISLHLADGLHLPFAPSTFDCAVMGFSLRNVADIGQVLREIYRVMKPGGRLVNLDLTLPEKRSLGSLPYFYLFRIVPLLGRFLARDPEAYTYLPHSLHQYPTAEDLKGLMEDVGWRRVRHYPLALGILAIHVAEKV